MVVSLMVTVGSYNLYDLVVVKTKKEPNYLLTLFKIVPRTWLPAREGGGKGVAYESGPFVVCLDSISSQKEIL